MFLQNALRWYFYNFLAKVLAKSHYELHWYFYNFLAKVGTARAFNCDIPVKSFLSDAQVFLQCSCKYWYS